MLHSNFSSNAAWPGACAMQTGSIQPPCCAGPMWPSRSAVSAWLPACGSDFFVGLALLVDLGRFWLHCASSDMGAGYGSIASTCCRKLASTGCRKLASMEGAEGQRSFRSLSTHLQLNNKTRGYKSLHKPLRQKT